MDSVLIFLIYNKNCSQLNLSISMYFSPFQEAYLVKSISSNNFLNLFFQNIFLVSFNKGGLPFPINIPVELNPKELDQVYFSCWDPSISILTGKALIKIINLISWFVKFSFIF